MKRNTLVWMLSAVAMVVVAGVTYWLGRTLLPPRTTAVEVGTIVPWYLTWGMIWMTHSFINQAGALAGIYIQRQGLPVYWYFRLKRPASGIVSESDQT